MPDTKKVILNKCYGGSRPSYAAYMYYAQKKGWDIFAYTMDGFHSYRRAEKPSDLRFATFTIKDYGDNPKSFDWENDVLYLGGDFREDPVLIEVVEALGKAASSELSRLVVVEIPADLDYVIDDYDGVETLHQRVEEW